MSVFPAPADYNKPIYKQHLHLLSLLKEVRDRMDSIHPPFPKGASLLEMLGKRCRRTPWASCCSSLTQGIHTDTCHLALAGGGSPAALRGMHCSDKPRGRTKYPACSKSMARQRAPVPCLIRDPSEAQSTVS